LVFHVFLMRIFIMGFGKPEGHRFQSLLKSTCYCFKLKQTFITRMLAVLRHWHPSFGKCRTTI